MLQVTLCVLLLLWSQDGALSVRIVELRVPTHAQEGGVALLGCQYDMEGDPLYSVKWYKDGDEFFRYSPNNKPSLMHFDGPGVEVDLSRSSSTEVNLVHLTQKSSGLYRCEVAGEAPSFQTTAAEKHINIQFLPQSGPHLTGGKDKYFPNDLVVMNCSSPASRPKANLKWLINDVPVSRERIYGPWESISSDRDDAVEVTLQLRFYVTSSDFENGVMRIKCQSTIAPMYQRETSSVHDLSTATDAEPPVPNVAGFLTDGAKSAQDLFPLLYLSFVLLIL